MKRSSISALGRALDFKIFQSETNPPRPEGSHMISNLATLRSVLETWGAEGQSFDHGFKKTAV